MKPNSSRRKFIKRTALGSAGLSVGWSASSYANIIGANDRIHFAVAGLNSRGKGLTTSIFDLDNCMITVACDVDSRAMASVQEIVAEKKGHKPGGEKDFRKVVERSDVDAVVIAAPDHWHAPMAIMAAQAGKDVYLEKPCCHSPREGELVVEAQKKYNRVVQMGNQQRSGPTSIQAVQDIRDGLIGDVYFGKAWYSNSRKSIGIGKKSTVPEWLDWELWQGPAPRRPYKDNYVHYHWHWFRNWGTGEINNNGTHELDICRWALGVDIPVKVSSSGGRYHFDDDWEFYDTQIANFEFADGKLISWEGKSCNAHQYFNRGRGVTIHGTEGTILMDRNGYVAFNQDGDEIKRMDAKSVSDTMNLVGAGNLTTLHLVNFIQAIRSGETLNAPIADAYHSNLMPHLGNISQQYGRSLRIDPANGHILRDEEAMSVWSREYEPGWEPVV
ncbi:MAG: Gfo/Idh/MocA family oxidoreductase [Saprospiraceae bacterium]|nr:Gfo/Idh/MocA family oxidoreductase [Saprospiraceae bacterium]